MQVISGKNLFQVSDSWKGFYYTGTALQVTQSVQESAARLQVLTQALFLQEVVANLHTISDQHRYPGIVQADQVGVCVDIHCRDVKPVLRAQALQCPRHFCTQMATPPDINGQLLRQESITRRITAR